MQYGFLTSSFRAGHPDFLDLPWERPFCDWTGHCARIEDLPRGDSRHMVHFVNYEGRIYALKEMAADQALKEYELLRGIEDLRLPVVHAVGHISTRTPSGEASVLITRYLDHSLPYHALFRHSSLIRYRDHILDAMAILLVQLHLAGVFWGDCSLNNTLFRRDAGRLQAYLVDAETSELRPALSEGVRQHDLEIMEENVGGALLDLVALGALPEGYPAGDTAAYVRKRYGELWGEVTRDMVIGPDERYRIHERIRALNALGFSVSEVELRAAQGGGGELRLRAMVTDLRYHRDLLHSLTGLEVEGRQARLMINELRELRAHLMEHNRRSTPLSVAAHHWLRNVYKPATERLGDRTTDDLDVSELYCQLLEHKWYLSERERRDVGHVAAMDDFLKTIRPAAQDAREEETS